MKRILKRLSVSASFLALFALWTLAVSYVDVKQIGPKNSAVGLSTINGGFHKLTGVHFDLYVITDWLGLVPVAVCFVFAILGLVQWIKRKNILKVDLNILLLGVFYIVTIVAYLFFESVVINYRPVLINNFLEASYPSSTTLLVLCVMPTTIMQIKMRLKSILIKSILVYTIWLFISFMVLGRLVSGVHWLSDIIGGILLSIGLVYLYYSNFE